MGPFELSSTLLGVDVDAGSIQIMSSINSQDVTVQQTGDLEIQDTTTGCFLVPSSLAGALGTDFHSRPHRAPEP